MMRSAIYSLALLLFFSACTESTGGVKSSKFLPSSMGGFDQLMVIVDDDIKATDLGDTLDEYFSAGYPVLFRPEPLMDVSYIDATSFQNFVRRSRNILFIGSRTGSDGTSKFIREMFGNEGLSKFTDERPYQFRKNVWAQNQLVGFVLAETDETIDDILREHSRTWLDRFMDSDLPEYRQYTYMSGVNKGLQKQLREYYQVDLEVPLDFQLAKDEDGFIWLRRDEPKAIINIMIDIQPRNPSRAFANRGIQRRNQLGFAHVSSELPGSYMSTDSTLGFVTKYSVVDNQPRFENRGLWRMVNDFKGGPFLHHYIHDIKNDRIIFLEGFVYGPTEDKKPLMRQVEAILATFELTEN